MLVDGDPDEHLVVDHAHQHRLAGSQHPSQPALGIELARLVVAQLFGQQQAVGIGMGHGHRPAVPVLVEEIHCAPIHHVGHGEFGDVAQRLLVVQR